MASDGSTSNKRKRVADPNTPEDVPYDSFVLAASNDKPIRAFASITEAAQVIRFEATAPAEVEEAIRHVLDRNFCTLAGYAWMTPLFFASATAKKQAMDRAAKKSAHAASAICALHAPPAAAAEKRI